LAADGRPAAQFSPGCDHNVGPRSESSAAGSGQARCLQVLSTRPTMS